MRVKGETGGVLKRGYKRGRYEPIKNHDRVKQLKNPKGVKGDKRSGVLGKVCCGRQSYVRWEACPGAYPGLLRELTWSGGYRRMRLTLSDVTQAQAVTR